MMNMKSVTGDYLLSLLFLPMTDERVLAVVRFFGWELPEIDERYEEEGEVAIQDEDGSGIALVFKELKNIDIDSKTGDLRLAELDFAHDRIVLPPYGLMFQDSYSICCNKLEGKAEYQSKRVKELKVWVREHPSGIKISIAIFFNKSMSEIRSIVAIRFDESRVGRYLVDAE